MNPFITQKYNSWRKWKTVLSSVSGVFGLLMLLAGGKLFAEKDVATGCFCLVIGILALWPVYISVRNWHRRTNAWDITMALEDIPEDVLSFSRLEKKIPMSNLIKNMQMLIKTGYINNVVIDSAGQTVTLNAPYRQGKNIHMDMICPYCGTKNNVLLGSVERCSRCNKFLPTGVEVRPDGTLKFM